ncbi:transposase [Shewanella sp. OPT22]|nr:transposase [Shewanella sp. OPT22]
MPKARKTIVSVDDTPFYHCVSRCVRRAFLCGKDSYSGKCYEHRREWVETRLLELTEVFSIDICAYAVMSNHVHIVLRVDVEESIKLTDLQVVERWHRLFKGTLLTHRFVKNESLSKWDKKQLQKVIDNYRNRLSDISWFMRSLNEPIARMANREDNCTGRFWEGRFKSQPLLDESAILACMAYVDLNPIRAIMADTPEASQYTSIRKRVESTLSGKQPKPLLPFIGNEKVNMSKGIAFHLEDYLVLVEETGRSFRDDKLGAIQASKHILQRLNIKNDNWLKLCSDFEQLFSGPVGCIRSLTGYTENVKLKRRQNVANCNIYFEAG